MTGYCDNIDDIDDMLENQSNVNGCTMEDMRIESE